MFNKIIVQAVSQEIDRRSADLPKPIKPPAGYNPLEEMRGGLYHWVLVPFNGNNIWCQLRCLNGTEMESAGGLSLIELSKSINPEQADIMKIIEIRNIQEALCKLVLNNPTFDQIFELIEQDDNVYKKARKDIKEIEDIDKSVLTEKQKREIEKDLNRLQLQTSFILPEDAFGFLTSWALGVDVSDIKKISRDQLLTSAILAENNHNSPHENISGTFTDRDKTDIDKTAWTVYREFKESKEIEKSAKGGMRWIGRE